MLAQHNALDVSRPARAFIAFDAHSAKTHITSGGFEAHGHVAKKPADDQLFLDADHAVVRAGHADIGDVGRATRKDTLVGGGDMRVSAENSSNAAIEIPAERVLLRCSFGMNIEH